MPRTITEAVRLEKNKDYNRPIELFQIFLDDYYDRDLQQWVLGTLYLATWPYDIEFYDENGVQQTYEAAAITRSATKMSKGMEADRYTLRIDNVDRRMSAYMAHVELQGRAVALWKIFLDDNGEPDGGFEDRVEMNMGYIDSPIVSEYSLRATVACGIGVLEKGIPGRMYTTNCTRTFGDTGCGADVPTRIGTIADISEDGRRVYPSGGVSQTYWTHGTFTTHNHMRVIVETSTSENWVELEFPLPTDVLVGDEYELDAGCDKTFDGAQGCEYWEGVLGDDRTRFYGGFRKIPELRDIRRAN